jgi:hypothetical protein
MAGGVDRSVGLRLPLLWLCRLRSELERYLTGHSSRYICVEEETARIAQTTSSSGMMTRSSPILSIATSPCPMIVIVWAEFAA